MKHVDAADYPDLPDYLRDTRNGSLMPFWDALHGRHPFYGAESNRHLSSKLRDLLSIWLSSGIRVESRRPDGKITTVREYPLRRSLDAAHSENINRFLRKSIKPRLTLAGGALPLGELPGRLPNENRSAIDLGLVSFPGTGTAAGEAMCLFLTLVDHGDARFRIAQCKACQRFGFARRQECFQNGGWHCEKCRASRDRAADAASVRERREEQRGRRLTACTNALSKYQRLYGAGDRGKTEWIKNEANKHLRTDKVTLNFVTRNLGEIEDRLDAQKGGK